MARLLLVLPSGDCRSVGRAGFLSCLVSLLLVACRGRLGFVSLRLGGLLCRAAASKLAVWAVAVGTPAGHHCLHLPTSGLLCGPLLLLAELAVCAVAVGAPTKGSLSL